MADPTQDRGATRRSIIGGLLGGLSLAAASPQGTIITASNAKQAGGSSKAGAAIGGGQRPARAPSKINISKSKRSSWTRTPQ